MSRTPPTGDMRSAMKDAVKRSKGNKKKAKEAKARWKQQGAKQRRMRALAILAVVGPLALVCLLYPLHSLGYLRLWSPRPLAAALSNPGQAEKLNISSHFLDEVPQSVDRLNKLKELTLDSNKISKLGPVWKLKELQVLRVNNNQIRDLPADIKNLTKLREIYISDNGLNALPKELFELDKLEVIVARNNKISTIPKEIKKLKKLKRLDLTSNQITTVPESIGELTKMEQLVLSGNQLSTAPNIRQMKDLRMLQVRNTGLTKTEISSLQNQIGEKGTVNY